MVQKKLDEIKTKLLKDKERVEKAKKEALVVAQERNEATVQAEAYESAKPQYQEQPAPAYTPPVNNGASTSTHTPPVSGGGNNNGSGTTSNGGLQGGGGNVQTPTPPANNNNNSITGDEAPNGAEMESGVYDTPGTNNANGWEIDTGW